MVKSFSLTELAVRIRAALRNQEASELSQHCVLGDLTINHAERRVSLAGRPVRLIVMEYRTLAEVSACGSRVWTYEHLLRRVWELEGDADVRPMRTAISSLRRKLGDDAENLAYIFIQLRVGYRMPKREPANGTESANRGPSDGTSA